MTKRWERFWHEPGSDRSLAVARVLLAGTALWIVLSRYDLPAVLEFPPPFWSGVSAAGRARFGLVLDTPAERVLWALLHGTLLLAVVGWRTRGACFLSGLLLYHFAPLESILWTPNPYLRGLTLPVLGLLILSFARPQDGRWPVRLIQLLLCQVYFFAGYAKLFESGTAWVSAGNMRGWLLVLDQAVWGQASIGTALAAHPWACGLMAWAGILFELSFPLVLFSGTARRLLVPAALLFHAANAAVFHIFFQDTALLLVFVDWDGPERGV